jgi:two-component system cell cycle sensor histidine kinase/response regulator CckA
VTRVLVADDVGENRYFLTALLEGHGYEVVVAGDGDEALRLAQGAPPDLVITDLLMPKMDGFELCRRWRADERLREVPFVVYTATYTDARDERLALSLGADLYLVKPQRPDDLLRALRGVLEPAARGPASGAGPHAADAREVELTTLREHRDALMRKLEKKIHDLELEVAGRQQAEQALRERAELWRIAGRMARVGGWSVKLDERRVRWSSEIGELYGIPADYCPTVDEALALFRPSTRARLADAFEACAQGGAPFDVEAELTWGDGAGVWVRTIGEAVRDEAGRVTRVRGAFQDVTPAKHADAERRHLEGQFLQAQKMESVGRLAGGVAHDFNNLLSVILSYVGLALFSLREGDPLRDDLDEVRKAGERAAELTRQLLTLSRKQPLTLTRVRVGDVVAELEGVLRRLLGEHIDVALHLADQGEVLSDRGQLEQVLMNLVVNARDAMPGGGRLVIETSSVELDEAWAEQHVGASPGRHVMLSVTDTGTGMSPDVRAHLFEPFFTTKAKGLGTGLGLSTVYGIVKQTGGSVWVYSELGRGSTFKVYLPRVDGVAAAEGRAGEGAALMTPPALAALGGLARGRETVLVVEDEEPVRKIAERILRGAGYQVLTASGGGDALLVSEQHEGPIELLLTDVVMPRMSGRELAARLVATRPGLEVLYMSGYPDHGLPERDAPALTGRFLSKPFAAVELTRKVREALDARGGREAPPGPG